uniref:Uncharacterized protein n=1 Tax=Candidatus Kentrum sp. LFY TaxID=2126342 RepID=A0A450UH82_9GAMM|nr:MAG: hypothetical protein BECKLFY1418A_GA0070994_101913 [Candidatus Kentron sp. LFY]
MGPAPTRSDDGIMVSSEYRIGSGSVSLPPLQVTTGEAEIGNGTRKRQRNHARCEFTLTFAVSIVPTTISRRRAFDLKPRRRWSCNRRFRVASANYVGLGARFRMREQFP